MCVCTCAPVHLCGGVRMFAGVSSKTHTHHTSRRVHVSTSLPSTDESKSTARAPSLHKATRAHTPPTHHTRMEYIHGIACTCQHEHRTCLHVHTRVLASASASAHVHLSISDDADRREVTPARPWKKSTASRHIAVRANAQSEQAPDKASQACGDGTRWHAMDHHGLAHQGTSAATSADAAVLGPSA